MKSHLRHAGKEDIVKIDLVSAAILDVKSSLAATNTWDSRV